MEKDIVIFLSVNVIVLGAILAISLPLLLRKKKADDIEPDTTKIKEGSQNYIKKRAKAV